VSAVGYRAFVFAASPYFVAGNRSTECRGAVSVGAVSTARGDASKNSYRPFEGVPRYRISGIECPVSSVRYTRANRQATEE
jgi:hypothetical protein